VKETPPEENVKKTRSREAARPKVDPAAEDTAPTAADRLAAAAVMLTPLAHSAATKIGPLAHSAADRVGPLAHLAAERVAPYAQQAADAVTPYAHQAADRLTPLAASVKERGASVLHEAGERLGPRLDEAMDRVGPAVEAARDKVSDELLPKLTEALAAVAASPLAVEAINRGKATLAAATGELVLPPEKPKRRWPKRLGVIAALSGLAYVLARKFLGSKDSQWQTARPTTPYVPPKPTAPDTAAAATAAPVQSTTPDTADDVPTAEHEAPGDDPQAGASAHSEYLQANGEAEPDQPAEGGVEESEAVVGAEEASTDQAPWAEGSIEVETSETEVVAGDGAPELVADDFPGTGPDTDPDAELVYVTESEPESIEVEPESSPVVPDPQKYSGEGVYVGIEPPEGYTIKGNQRSMKYHLPESGGYARTVAEVWFSSEAAAQACGFVRAQR
jgi:hypothetical protein